MLTVSVITFLVEVVRNMKFCPEMLSGHTFEACVTCLGDMEVYPWHCSIDFGTACDICPPYSASDWHWWILHILCYKMLE